MIRVSVEYVVVVEVEYESDGDEEYEWYTEFDGEEIIEKSEKWIMRFFYS